jgi:F0F1-type ATP synthase epsilon subunit
MISMRLIITTPTAIALDENFVRHVRAEDAAAPSASNPAMRIFLTTLSICVLRWHKGDGERYVAVRGGVLRVREGKLVEIATREAVVNDDFARKCCNFESGDGGRCERKWAAEVSGSQIEQLVDEPILLANIIVAEPPRLPLADHVHGPVFRDRSPSCSELAQALLGLHSSFDRSMILLQDVVQILDPIDGGGGGAGFLPLSLRQSPRRRGGPDQC